MDRSEASALADLQMHWDEAYVITLDGHIWSARYRTSAEELRAHTSSELRELIRSDYGYRQKADLIAYDPDGDFDDEDADDDLAPDDGAADGDDLAADDGAAVGDDEAAEGDDQTDADEYGEQQPRPDCTRRQDVDAGQYAPIRGERMSL